MPIELPDLDDRTYDDLMQEALSLIPSYAQDWTNYNPSDPGITLLELFAYLSEMMIYRLDRVTDANQYAFLKLLNGSDWQRSPQKDLNQEIRDTVLKIRRSERAVTGDDFERLAIGSDPNIARVRCVPRRNLVSENPLNPEERPAQVSLVIVPYPPKNSRSDSQEWLKPQPTPELLTKVRDYLEPKRLLTTRVQVVAPRYVEVGVNFTLYLNRDVKKSDIETKVITTLQNFLNPLTGGADGKGWTFGRNVYVSELYDLLDRYKGIDYVTATKGPERDQNDKPIDKEELTVNDSNRLIKDKNNKLIAIQIQPEELVTSGSINLQFLSPLDAGKLI